MLQQRELSFHDELPHDLTVLVLNAMAKAQMEGRGAPAEMYLNQRGGWDEEHLTAQIRAMSRMKQHRSEQLAGYKRTVLTRYTHALVTRSKMDEMSDQISTLVEEIESLNTDLSSITAGYHHLSDEPMVPACPPHEILQRDMFKGIRNKYFTLCEPDLLLQVRKPRLQVKRPLGEGEWDFAPGYDIQWTHALSYVAVDVKNVFRAGHDISQVHKFFDFCPQPVRVIIALQPSLWVYRHHFEDAGAECFLFDGRDERYQPFMTDL